MFPFFLWLSHSNASSHSFIHRAVTTIHLVQQSRSTMPFLRPSRDGFEEYQVYQYKHIAHVYPHYHPEMVPDISAAHTTQKDPTSHHQLRSSCMLVALVQNGTTPNAIAFAHKGCRNELPMMIAAEQHGYSIGHRTSSGHLQLQSVGFNYMGAVGPVRYLQFVRLWDLPQSPLIGFIVTNPQLSVFDPGAQALPWCILHRLSPQQEANYLVRMSRTPSHLPPDRDVPRIDQLSSL